MRDRFFLVPLVLGGLTGCQSFRERLFSPLTTRLDLVNTLSVETNRLLGMANDHLGIVNAHSTDQRPPRQRGGPSRRDQYQAGRGLEALGTTNERLARVFPVWLGASQTLDAVDGKLAAPTSNWTGPTPGSLGGPEARHHEPAAGAGGGAARGHEQEARQDGRGRVQVPGLQAPAVSPALHASTARGGPGRRRSAPSPARRPAASARGAIRAGRRDRQDAAGGGPAACDDGLILYRAYSEASPGYHPHHSSLPWKAVPDGVPISSERPLLIPSSRFRTVFSGVSH